MTPIKASEDLFYQTAKLYNINE